MVKTYFELSSGKPNWIRVFPPEAIIEFEAADSQTALLLVDVLNAFVSDIVIERYQSPSITVASDWLPV